MDSALGSYLYGGAIHQNKEYDDGRTLTKAK